MKKENPSNKTETQEKYGELVRKRFVNAMEKKGYNNSSLAEALGVTDQTISDYRNKEGLLLRVPFERIIDLCALLDIDPEHLYGKIEKSTNQLESICSYTGLSEQTVKMFHSAPDCAGSHYYGEMISYFLDTYQEFPDLLMKIEQYFVDRKKYDDIASQMAKSTKVSKDYRELRDTGFLQKQVNGDLMGCLTHIVEMYQAAKYDKKINDEIYG